MTILVFIIILAVLVLSHEFGHFFVAKLFGIRVDEFGFGFPPKLFSFKYGETVYSINLLPLGGFVKIFGEDPTREVLDMNHKDHGRSLYRKPRYIQAAVIGAGVFCNIILGWVMLSGGFMVGLPVPAGFTSLGPKPEDSRLLITEIVKDSPADIAGLRPGYSITYLATKDNALDKISPEEVVNFIGFHGDEEVYVGYKAPREGGPLVGIGLGPLDYIAETKTLVVVPKTGVIRKLSGQDRPGIGISMEMVGVLKLPFFDALYAGLVGIWSLLEGTVTGLFHFIMGFFVGKSSLVSISGPVGLVGMVGDASRFGLAYLLALTALISVNLAVLNLVPFPALDGGRLFFLFIESIIRRPLNPKIVNALSIGGFLALLGLMAVVTWGDILKLITG